MVVAALVGGATGFVALDRFRVFLGVAVLGTLVGRAHCFAALGLLALAILALLVLGVIDERITVRALDGVAVLQF